MTLDEFISPVNTIKKMKAFKADLEAVSKNCSLRLEDINLVAVLNFKRTKTLKNESRGKLLEEIRKREDARIDNENG